MKPICQNIVKKDSLYPLIKHHVLEVMQEWHTVLLREKSQLYTKCQ